MFFIIALDTLFIRNTFSPYGVFTSLGIFLCAVTLFSIYKKSPKLVHLTIILKITCIFFYSISIFSIILQTEDHCRERIKPLLSRDDFFSQYDRCLAQHRRIILFTFLTLFGYMVAGLSNVSYVYFKYLNDSIRNRTVTN